MNTKMQIILPTNSTKKNEIYVKDLKYDVWYKYYNDFDNKTMFMIPLKHDSSNVLNNSRLFLYIDPHNVYNPITISSHDENTKFINELEETTYDHKIKVITDLSQKLITKNLYTEIYGLKFITTTVEQEPVTSYRENYIVPFLMCKVMLHHNLKKYCKTIFIELDTMRTLFISKEITKIEEMQETFNTKIVEINSSQLEVIFGEK